MITKEYIDKNIRPFSGNDALFKGTLNEVLLLDIEPKFGKDFIMTLKTGVLTPEIEEILNKGLRDAIGYYILSRALRTAGVTITKYGTTVKMSEDSNPPSNGQIVANCNYYRQVADELVKPLVKCYLKNHKVRGTYQNTRLVGY